jgi:dipeptidyl aminopeptidase/acylaminoacyl peptidase
MSERFGIDRFLSIRAATTPSFSPCGRWLAFLTNITGVPQVWESDGPERWPEQRTFLSERIGHIAYSPISAQLLFAMDAGGNERMQLYLLSVSDGKLSRLTHDSGAIHTPGPWSPNGRRLAYASNARNPQHFDVYVQDLDGGVDRVYTGTGTTVPVAWSPDADRLVLRHSRSNLHHDLLLLDLAGGEVARLTPAGDDSWYTSVCWPRPDRLYLVTNQGSELGYVATLELGSGDLRPALTFDHEVEAVVFDRQGETAAVVVNADGSSQLFIWRPGSRPRRVLREPGVISSLAWDPAGRRLAVASSGPCDPPDIHVLDPLSGAVVRHTRSSRAGIPRRLLVAPELVRYPTFDGRAIPAYYYRPADCRPPFPVVVDVHGGPESQERPDFNPVIQYLVHRRYAVLAPNVRGSSGYGRSYLALDDVRLRMDAVRDLEYGARWLKAAGGDPARLAAMGGSYGGFMVLAALTSYPATWAAGVDVVGIANFETFLANTGPWRRHLREAEYGSLERDRDFLREISPIHKVDRIAAPLMVIHGANDPRVPIGEAEQIVDSLRRRNLPVTYLRFDDEGHGVVKLPNRIRAYSAVAEFLDTHFGRGDEGNGGV